VVHHGGIGTTAQALAAAVPQLVMHMAHDQPDNAAHVLRLGVGKPISPKSFRAPAVTKALGELLNSPEIAMRCRSVAAMIGDTDSVGVATSAIEALVS
jgi:UDP:flavonoid glycosyltransferase YjiC (YdhE family)